MKKPLFTRLLQYTFVGGGTFLIDLSLIYILKTFLAAPDSLAIGLGFLTAISINFIISYHFVFNGTKQTKSKGYIYFLTIAGAGLAVVTVGTLSISTTFGISIYFARILIAGLVGLINFLLNNFFNFKM